MLERSRPEPLAESVLRTYYRGGRGGRGGRRDRGDMTAQSVAIGLFLLLKLNKRGNGLKAPIIRARIYSLYGRIQRREVTPKLS
jgi:hypothetical protein